MVAKVVAVVGARRGIAKHVLGVEFAADFVESGFDGAAFEGGVIAAAGRDRGQFQSVFGFGAFGLPDDNLGERNQVNAIAARASGGGNIDGAWRTGNRGDTGRRNGNGSVVARLGLQFGADGGKADGEDGDVLKLGLAEDFAESGFAAGVESFGNDEQDAASGDGIFRGGFAAVAEHGDAFGHGVEEAMARVGGS